MNDRWRPLVRFVMKCLQLVNAERHAHQLRHRFAAWAAPRIMRVAQTMPWAAAALARFWAVIQCRAQPPYGRVKSADIEDMLPPRPMSAERSVLFLHNSYYHFLYLAAALRRRGWDAVLVSNFSPHNSDQQFFHGEDTNLFSEDPEEFRARLQALHDLAPNRFRMVHFAGMHCMSLFPDNFHWTAVPWDFIEWKRRGMKIGYTISGCNDGIRQSVYKKHKDACAKCVWELRPDICSDVRNTGWGEKLVAMCDLVAVEEEYGHEWRGLPFVHREPLTMVLDPDLWKPDLEVPEAWRLQRADGELIVLHGFGNAETRRGNGRNIKGTSAVLAAIDRLQSEGFKVRLEHPTNVRSQDMRFLQVQADVIVDQLNVGRYGAQAREGMMLGVPTVCHIDRREPAGVPELTCWDECPLVDATEETIYPVLKQLLSSPEERERIGQASREYAIKWHAADSAAERFEWLYDRMMDGLPLNVFGSEVRGVKLQDANVGAVASPHAPRNSTRVTV